MRKSNWPGFALIAVVLVVWQLASSLEFVDPVSMPPITEIARSWWESVASGALPAQIVPSLSRIFIGFGIATVVAVPLGLLMGSVPMIYRLLEPATELLRPIPSSAYIPVAILFLGIRDQMKVFIIVVACIFPILLNTYGGVRGIDPVLIDTGRTFGLTQWRALRQITLPACLPSILTGMRISLGVALLVSVVAEMISGNSGVGYFILDMQRVFRTPDMFAGVFTLGLIGYTINYVFVRFERRALHWRGASS